MEWAPLWENAVLRTAAFITAVSAGILSIGIIWRYVIVGILWRYLLVFPFKAVRGFVRGVKKLTAEVEQVRALVAAQHKLVYRELNANGGSSLIDKVNKIDEKVTAVVDEQHQTHKKVTKVERDQMHLAGSVIAYLFRHDPSFDDTWEHLRREYGLDRDGPKE